MHGQSCCHACGRRPGCRKPVCFRSRRRRVAQHWWWRCERPASQQRRADHAGECRDTETRLDLQQRRSGARACRQHEAVIRPGHAAVAAGGGGRAPGRVHTLQPRHRARSSHRRPALGLRSRGRKRRQARLPLPRRQLLACARPRGCPSLPTPPVHRRARPAPDCHRRQGWQALRRVRRKRHGRTARPRQAQARGGHQQFAPGRSQRRGRGRVVGGGFRIRRSATWRGLRLRCRDRRAALAFRPARRRKRHRRRQCLGADLHRCRARPGLFAYQFAFPRLLRRQSQGR